jgi:hypothetical protein
MLRQTASRVIESVFLCAGLPEAESPVSAAVLSVSQGAVGVRRSDTVLMNAVGPKQRNPFEASLVRGAYLDHVEKLNPNAIVALQDRGGLLAQSNERDAQLARGLSMGRLHVFILTRLCLRPTRHVSSVAPIASS